MHKKDQLHFNDFKNSSNLDSKSFHKFGNFSARDINFFYLTLLHIHE